MIRHDADRGHYIGRAHPFHLVHGQRGEHDHDLAARLPDVYVCRAMLARREQDQPARRSISPAMPVSTTRWSWTL